MLQQEIEKEKKSAQGKKPAVEPLAPKPQPKRETPPPKKEIPPLPKARRPSRAPLMRLPADYPREGAIGYLYELAFSNYKKEEFEEAQGYFIKILLVSPRQRLARKYLQIIRENFLK